MDAKNNNEVCMTLVYCFDSNRLEFVEPFGSVAYHAVDTIRPGAEANPIMLKVRCKFYPNMEDINTAEVLLTTGAMVVLIEYSANGQCSRVRSNKFSSQIIGTLNGDKVNDETAASLVLECNKIPIQMATAGSGQLCTNRESSYPSLEYLRDSSSISIGPSFFNGNKFLLILSNDSVTHCCPHDKHSSADLVIRDRDHANIRFCIGGAALALPTIRAYIQHKTSKIGKIVSGKVFVNGASGDSAGTFTQELTVQNQYKYRYVDERSKQEQAGILVTDGLLTINMEASLSTSIKALIISYGVMLAMSKHKEMVVNFLGSVSEITKKMRTITNLCQPLPVFECGNPRFASFNIPKTEQMKIRLYQKNKACTKYSFVLMDAKNNNEVCMTLVYNLDSNRLEFVEPFGSVAYQAVGMGGLNQKLQLFSSPIGECCGEIEPISLQDRRCGQSYVFDMTDEPDNHPNKTLTCFVSEKLDCTHSLNIVNRDDESILTFNVSRLEVNVSMYAFLSPAVKLLPIAFVLKLLVRLIDSSYELFCPEMKCYRKNYFSRRQLPSVEPFNANYESIMYLIHPGVEANPIMLKVRCKFYPNMEDINTAEVLLPTGATVVLIEYSADGQCSRVRSNKFSSQIIGTLNGDKVNDETAVEDLDESECEES
ncbi:hypothetical protein EB796_003290 [Bugula neritina]|uniref:Uncharacterized protein n=1 Tax=Bugula neritina TaxID=10212 RepID=A0A7J7KJI4_BUGNE|nr:hypothetical protein EB796_003290 [Bugula neritina]